ncbi:hypothetical protein CTheo_5237 [Ceratobasidium theobromae]|uniref:SGNH hydrolase-type esterase domain-containing protein n=1 Tax=Ceratobasidium theobromae TaxID=1582974 RepID=A0A5N5QIM3_9AGAM|nr:hypothetical protein CTheo_5237 [Ceratobasidium theobromae]
MRTSFFVPAALLTAGALAAPKPRSPAGELVILPNSSLLHKHGRWDTAPGTWWAGSGLKFVASGLTSLTLNLGNHTTTPQAAVALSVDYSDFTTLNVSAGANVIPIPASAVGQDRVIRINVEGWQNNRMHLESIVTNLDAVITPYKPSPLRFQFIGDSLSAGQYNPRGVNDAWTFLTAEKFKAEQNINAQPGACLVDQLCWGNYHGVSYQYFQTEDTGYYYTTDHNYTTPWDFTKDLAPTHLVLAIGANDNAYQISSDVFENTLNSFITDLRKLYPQQPLFVFTAWGWPNDDGVSPFGTYYDAVYANAVKKRTDAGDNNIFLVNTTGWVGYDGVIPNNGHPNELGHQQVVTRFTAWLEQWGLEPMSNWQS